MAKYGSLLKEAREKQGINLEVFADNLLLELNEYKKVESDELELSDNRLTFACNLLGVSKRSLLQGKLEEQQSYSDIQERLKDVNEKLDTVIYDKNERQKMFEANAVSLEMRDVSFADQVDMVMEGKYPGYSVLRVGDTPKVLQDVGCEALPLFYTQKHLRNAIKEVNEKKHQHGLSIGLIKALPSLLEEPALVLDSFTKNDSIVVVTAAADDKKRPIIASIKLNGRGIYEIEDVSCNFVTSVYGRNNFLEFIETAASEDKVLFFDKIKTENLLLFQGLQLPETYNKLPSKSIIHPTNNLVNAIKKDISYLLRKTLLDKDKNGNEYDRGWIDGIYNSIAAVENSKDFQEALVNVHNLGGIDGEAGYDKGWDDSITEALSIIEISVGLSIDEVLDYSGEKAVASEILIEKNNEQTNNQEEKEEEESIAAKGLKI